MACWPGSRMTGPSTSGDANVVVFGLMLLFLSSRDLVGGGALQEPEQLPGDHALQAPADLARALALAGTAGGVGPGRWVLELADHDDGVQRAVELAIPTTVEAVTHDLARGGLDRGGAGQHRKRSLGADPTRV